MANTYTQLYIQFVFAVRYRNCLIQPSWEGELHKYITGIVQNLNNKMIAINGMPDHVHLFIGLNPLQSLSSLMQIVKGESSKWINSEGFLNTKFQWQEGYGAFSYGHSQIDSVYNYILGQKEHHKTTSFLTEYKSFLDHFQIPYEERFIFNEIADFGC